MKVITATGEEIALGTTETAPTISLVDFSRRVTDDFGVTTVVKRDFTRRFSVRLAVPTENVDTLQQRLAQLRATSAQWVADDRFQWLTVQGFYKEFELDLAVPPLSYCTLTVEGLAESEVVADAGGDPAPVGSSSTLRLLHPVAVSDAVLSSSNVPENDYPEWAAGTTYAAGAHVIKASLHRVFESATGGNVGHDPAAETGQWIDIGPTNRWAMFDQALGTATARAGSIAVTLAPGPVNAVALLDLVGATVRVQTAGYDQTKAVVAGAIAFLDVPPTGGAITITVAGAGTVSVGTLLAGPLVSLGITGDSPTAGITDFSRKDVDDFGEVTIVPRGWAKRMAARALIRSDAVDLVANRIAAVRALPCLWIGDDGLDTLTVYGFFKDFSLSIGENVSTLSLTVEGLAKADEVRDLAVSDLAGSGTLAGLDAVYFDGGNIKESATGPDATLTGFKTNLGTAASIAGQGTGATANTLAQLSAVEGAKLGTIAPGATVGAVTSTNLYRSDGTTILLQGDVRTVEGTAAAISGQGALATKSVVAYGTGDVTGFGTLAGRGTARLGLEVYRADGVTAATDAALVTSLGTAAAITGQGALATKSAVAYGTADVTGFGTLAARTNVRLQNEVYRADGTTLLTDATAVTSLGTAAGIAGQGAFATANSAAYGSSLLTGFGTLAPKSLVRLGGEVYRADGATLLTDATAVTSLGTAAAITGQGALATKSAVTYGTGDVSGFGSLAARSTARLGVEVYRADGTTLTTDAMVVTSLGTAAGISGQGALATKSAVAYGSSDVSGFGTLAGRSTARLGTEVYRADGTTVTTDAMVVTSLGTASAISGQGALATLSAVDLLTTQVVNKSLANLDATANTKLGGIAAGATVGADINAVNLVDGGSGAPTTPLGRGTVLTALGTASAISGQGALATKSTVTYGTGDVSGFGSLAARSTARLGTEVYRADGTTVATDALLVTSLGTAAGISGQGTLATRGNVYFGSAYLTEDAAGATPATLAAFKTASGTAAAITGQGALATKSSVAYGSGDVSGFGTLAGRSTARLGTEVYRADGTTLLTDAAAVTSLGTAAGIAGQGALATLSSADYQTQVGGTGKPDLYASISDNIAQNSTLASGTSPWAGNTGLVRTAPAAGDPGYYFRGTGTFSAYINGGAQLPLPSGISRFALSAKVRANHASGYLRCFVQYYDSTGTFLAQTNVDLGPNVANTWALLKGFTSAVPALAVTYQAFVQTQPNVGTTVDFYGFRLGTFETEATAGAIASGNLFRADGLTVMSQAEVRTVEGTAAAISGQGAFATVSSAAYGSSLLTGFGSLAARTNVRIANELLRADGTTATSDAMLVTALGTASAISGQGALATKSAVAYGTGDVTGFGSLAARSSARIGVEVYRADGTTVTTDAMVVTSLGTASAITGQGALATKSAVAYGSSDVSGFGSLAGRSTARLGTEVYRADGTTLLTDAAAVTSLGTAAAISGQGALATLSSVPFTGTYITGADKPSPYAGTSINLIAAGTSGAEIARITITGNSYSKSVAADNMNAWAYSKEAFTGGCVVTATPSFTGSGASGGDFVWLGFTESGAPASGSADMVYGIYWYNNGAFIYQVINGAANYVAGSGTAGAYGAAPQLTVSYDEGLGRIFINGTELTSAAASLAAGKTMRVLLTGFNGGAKNILFSAARSVKLYRDDARTVMAQAEVRTPEGTAAGIAGQGTLATLSSVTDSQLSGNLATRVAAHPSFPAFLDSARVVDAAGTQLYSVYPSELGANKTETRTASAISGQGALATLSAVDLSTSQVTGKSLANLDSTASSKLGGIEAGANVTGTHTAAAITGQGSLATVSSVDFESASVTNKGRVSKLDATTGRVSDPTIYNTQSLLGPNSTTNLVPSYTVGGSNVTVSLPAHTRKITGPSGAITLSYGAVSGVVAFSSYWTAYIDDPNLTGFASPTATFTSNPDDLLAPGRYQIASGVAPSAAGTGGTTTSGGGGARVPVGGGQYP